MMTQWMMAWRTRQPRERLFLATGGVVVFAALIYVLVVEPIHTAGKRAERALPGLRAQAAEMRQWADEARTLKSRVQRSATPDAAVLASTGARFGLSPQVSASPGGGFSVHLEKAQFSGLRDWLANVQTEHRLFVRVARMQKQGDGAVRAELALAP